MIPAWTVGRGNRHVEDVASGPMPVVPNPKGGRSHLREIQHEPGVVVAVDTSGTNVRQTFSDTLRDIFGLKIYESTKLFEEKMSGEAIQSVHEMPERAKRENIHSGSPQMKADFKRKI